MAPGRGAAAWGGGPMIRVLHTADWHLGHELAGWTRGWEQAQALAQLCRLAVEHEVDALLVAGDVFDHQNPSNDSLRLLYETLAHLARELPGLAIVLVAGNHDSAGRIDAPSSVLGAIGVRAIGALASHGGRPDVDRHLVTVKSRSNWRQTAGILAVPYLRAVDLPGLAGGAATGATDDASRIYTALAADARKGRPRLDLIATGHLHATGGALSESLSERRITLGTLEALPLDVFPADLAYVALGHLHRAQTLAGSGQGPQVRYSGSLIPLSAAERCYGHGASLIEIEAGETRVRHLALDRPVPFLRLPVEGHADLAAFEEALARLDLEPDLPVERWPILQPAVRLDGKAAALVRAEVSRICDRFAVRAIAPDLLRPEAAEEAPAAPVRQLAEFSPEELFALAYARSHGAPPGPEHLALFRRALAEEAA